MARIILELTSEEVNKSIPYALICMTRYGSAWGTSRRKRRWVEEFSEPERAKAGKFFKQAHLWTLVRGVPETVRMTPETFDFWQRLGEFCGSI